MSDSDINVPNPNPTLTSEEILSKTDVGTPEATVDTDVAQDDESKKSLEAAAEDESDAKGPSPDLEPTKNKGTSFAPDDLEIDSLKPPKAPGDLARGTAMKPTAGAGRPPQGVKKPPRDH